MTAGGRKLASKPALAVVAFTLLAVPAHSLSSNAAAQTSGGEHVAARWVDLEQSTEQATLTFGLSAPLQASAFVLADPGRVIVDLPETDFGLTQEKGGETAKLAQRRNTLVKSFRYGQLEPGKSRIVVDLVAPAQVLRVACEAATEGDIKARLIIALSRTNEASFNVAVQASRARLAALAQPKSNKETEPVSSLPVVVLDPGHGGIDRGARVKGLIEKDIVLDFAKDLEAKLEASGRFKILMTRRDDRFVSLSERVRIGHDNNASLFVSIHADTLSEAARVSGATIYTLSDRASDAEAARVAEKENQSDVIAGLDQPDEKGEVSGILNDLARRETRAYSHMFAHTLVGFWRAAGRLNKNPRRSAGFRVLRAPDVPSVLLELGYLSNGRDSHALKSTEWRDRATGQTAAAIEEFFVMREKTAPLRPVTAADPDFPAGKIPPQ